MKAEPVQVGKLNIALMASLNGGTISHLGDIEVDVMAQATVSDPSTVILTTNIAQPLGEALIQAGQHIIDVATLSGVHSSEGDDQ